MISLVSYSLGDAIDWKLNILQSYSEPENNLLLARGRDRLETERMLFALYLSLEFSYSLGDAIDWKPIKLINTNTDSSFILLLARGRDRLETVRFRYSAKYS